MQRPVSTVEKPGPVGKYEDSIASTEESSSLQFRNLVPKGGFLSGVFNLGSATLGAGIMSLPVSFMYSGIFMSTVYLIVITASTIYSVWLIGLATKKTNIRSFEGMSKELLGRGGDIFTAIIMWLLCFGACIAYVIVVMGMWESIQTQNRWSGYWGSRNARRLLTCIIWAVLMLPISLPREINSLRYVSGAGIITIIFFMICIITQSARWMSDNGGINDTVEAFQTGNVAIQGLSLFVFSYLCQPNVFEVWNEKKHPTPSNITWEAGVSMTIVGVLYWLTGFFGYAQFGSSAPSNIVLKYNPLTDPLFAVAYIGILIKLSTSFALHIFPCRDSIYHFLGWNLFTVPLWKNILVCASIATISMLVGLFVSDVDTVFGLVGGLCGGFLAFIFPALFIMYAGDFSVKSMGIVHYLLTYALLLAGVIALVFGTGASIYGARF